MRAVTSHMSSDWVRGLRAYLAVTLGANLVWEAAHLPLYTLWQTGTLGEKVFAVVHCTGGDLLIATASLVGALAVCGHRDWPRQRFRPVAALTLAAGLVYTSFSEWLNTVVRGAWSYSDLMPVVQVAGLELGLSPLLQWVVVPALALACARRRSATAPEDSLADDQHRAVADREDRPPTGEPTRQRRVSDGSIPG